MKTDWILAIFLWCLSLPIYAEINFDIDNYQAQWADQRGVEIGDIVTILIKEKARASSSAGLDADNSSSVGISGQWQKNEYGGKGKISSELNGDASTVRDGSISATITARITEMDSFGLLKIEGSQFVVVNGEEQKILITGFIREEDLTSENAILSSRIDSARIEMSGVGEVDANRNPNIFQSMFRWLGF
ncbi:flagellar basal body L-ring protein FlgH [Motilimonas cestriensis]|uniref:Flagellar basal body L-ring protein FlgH n=1 Tax=Motilimonas cestriensis TaxID=2742685 RepID=A0ABS8WDI5_9GAMM|nr:flagellar basal body L-ring protein FlgH [Motilimonas cestriensis]MCE2597112.1 flagellar basal body L-ring protein FlgH [Motilimonas cestriensis]